MDVASSIFSNESRDEKYPVICPFVSSPQEYSGAPFTGSNPTNDIRVVGFGLVTLLLIIALIGLDWEAKVLVYQSYNTMLSIALYNSVASSLLHMFLSMQPLVALFTA